MDLHTGPRPRLVTALEPGVRRESWGRAKVHSGSELLRLTGGIEVSDEEGEETPRVEPS